VEWCGGFKASVIMNDEFDFDFEAKHNERVTTIIIFEAVKEDGEDNGGDSLSGFSWFWQRLRHHRNKAVGTRPHTLRRRICVAVFVFAVNINDDNTNRRRHHHHQHSTIRKVVRPRPVVAHHTGVVVSPPPAVQQQQQPAEER
jgi:hypothetical protein